MKNIEIFLRGSYAKGLLCIACLFSTLISCSDKETAAKVQAVDDFAEAYFNWQLGQAAQYVTTSSRSWLGYAASQLSQRDIDFLRAENQGASYKILALKTLDANNASASIEVNKYYYIDTIGREGHFLDKAHFVLQLKTERGHWRVSLDGLPKPIPENK